MGNRAYLTINDDIPKTYYLHWNGGLDTIAPLCRVVFDHNIKSVAEVISFISSLGIKTELQDHPMARTWNEENEHWFVDLKRQTLERTTEKNQVKVWLPHLQEAFDNYNNTAILEGYRGANKLNYWFGIIEEGNKFFGKGSKDGL